jgi:CRP-like cAMP-binding protein
MSALKKPILVEESDDVLETIKDCDFFKKFPADHYQSLEKITEVCHLSAGTKLVTQGQINDSIYFLMSGVIGIYINGSLASKLQRKGDLVGEMDLVSQRPSNATIKVEADSELIKIPVASIRDLPFEGQEYFEQNLYRFFAIMLITRGPISLRRR